MIYRTLGKTGLTVSALGMGTGGADKLGQVAGVPEADILDLIHQVFDLGVNLFDTAPDYMDSERILGRAIKTLPREKYVVSTKVALVGADVQQVMTSDEVTASVEASLRRLQLTHIDVLLIAVANPSYFNIVVDDHLPILEKLKKQGKIRFIGSSELTRSDGAHTWLQHILPTNVIDVAMIGHNMINQSAQQWVLPLCKRHDIGVLNVFIVRNIFANSSRRRDVIADLKNRELLPHDLHDEDPFSHILKDENIDTLPEAAYRYAAYTEGVTTAMCGSIHLHEFKENIKSLEKGPLPTHVVEWLQRTFGHIAEAIGN